MKQLFLALELMGLIVGTLSALAGEIDLAILFWVLSIYMAIRGEK